MFFSMDARYDGAYCSVFVLSPAVYVATCHPHSPNVPPWVLYPLPCESRRIVDGIPDDWYMYSGINPNIHPNDESLFVMAQELQSVIECALHQCSSYIPSALPMIMSHETVAHKKDPHKEAPHKIAPHKIASKKRMSQRLSKLTK